MTKPNLPDWSNNLELEAATKAIAPDKLRQHGVLSWLADFSTFNYIVPLPHCAGMTRIPALLSDLPEVGG